MARELQRTRGRLALGLLFVLIFAALIVPAFAQDGPPPAVPPLPNSEPTAGDEVSLAASSEEEAVLAALAAYEASPAAAEALAQLPEESLLQSWWTVYAPVVISGRGPTLDPGQQPTPTPAPAPQPDPSAAAVALSVRARPGIIVRPGELITYTFTLRNLGSNRATQTVVNVPFNPQHVTPLGTRLSTQAGDWMSNLSGSSYQLTFGALAAGAERSGQVIVRVGAGVPVRASNPVVIDARATYIWRDGGSGGQGRSNWAPVVVGSGAVHGDFVWVRVTPDRGPVGTSYAFFSNRFTPGERVVAWVNVNRGAGGVRALPVSGVVNSRGEVTLQVRGADTDPDLPRGTHQIVLAGQRSGLQGVVDFTIQ